jgi:hypothetical protein
MPAVLENTSLPVDKRILVWIDPFWKTFNLGC